jgi:hypothetical protein
MSQLGKSGASNDRAALSTQLADVNQRIAVVDNMIARIQGGINGSPDAATTVVPQSPLFIRKSPPDPTALWASVFTIVLLFFPISITLARRMWRRTPSASAPIPAALDERLARIEQSVEATAIEVERIGEGQRFVTRLLTESREGAQAQLLSAPASFDQKVTDNLP